MDTEYLTALLSKLSLSSNHSKSHKHDKDASIARAFKIAGDEALLFDVAGRQEQDLRKIFRRSDDSNTNGELMRYNLCGSKNEELRKD
jgi:hypothetical protein